MSLVKKQKGKTTMETNENFNIPFQLKQIIDNMLNEDDNVYIRGNYRMRLDSINREITKAIRKYDDQVNMANLGKAPRRKRA
jgi:hypothetical protein